MTACLYSWYNGNDPDDMFYWHSSQIPDSPTGSGGNALAYFHPFNFQTGDRRVSPRAASTKRTRRSAKRSTGKIQELLHEQVPVIFISWGKIISGAAQQYRRLLAECLQPHAVERAGLVSGLNKRPRCSERSLGRTSSRLESDSLAAHVRHQSC